MAIKLLDNCDNVTNWVSSDNTNFAKSQDTGDKQEGTGSIKVIASSEPTWDLIYSGDVEPDADGWTLSGADYCSVAGGICTIDTVTPGGTAKCSYQKTPAVDFDSGITAEIRVKVISSSAAGNLTFLVGDNAQDETIHLFLYTDHILFKGSTTETYNMNTTDDFHTYRITVSGTTAKLYIDGILRITLTVRSLTLTYNFIRFGDDSSTDGYNSKSEWDYVKLALGEVKSPNEFLNDVITRDLGAGNEVDLSNYTKIRFWIKSTRTGSYLQFGVGETAWNNNTYNITINSADTWEEKEWDISGISSANKNAIRYLGFKCTNADVNFTMKYDFIRAYPVTSNFFPFLL
ncbi:MAG: hypothetical protein ACTSPI_00685 [Candidatus Heimdallarchaeaceae archaeon]